jgi:hypothetical protein
MARRSHQSRQGSSSISDPVFADPAALCPELVATGLKAHAIGSVTGAVDASLDHSCGAIVLSSTKPLAPIVARDGMCHGTLIPSEPSGQQLDQRHSVR